jgi:AcrR family transcriptional regulator
MPSSRHDLTREFVSRTQRDRLIDAMARTVAERGYASAPLGEVCTAAGVSTRAFYQHFADKEACFLATFERGVGLLQKSVALAYLRPGRWPQRMHRGLDTLLRILAAEPAFAALAVVEVLAAGPRARTCRRELLETFAVFFADAPRPAGAAPVPAGVVDAVIAGVYGVIYDFASTGRAAELPERLSDLTYLSWVPRPRPPRPPEHRNRRLPAGERRPTARTGGRRGGDRRFRRDTGLLEGRRLGREADRDGDLLGRVGRVRDRVAGRERRRRRTGRAGHSPPVTLIGRDTPAEKSRTGLPASVPGTHGPLMDAGPFGATVTVQEARPEMVVTTPACGMVMVPTEPASSYCSAICHSPLVEFDTVRAVVNSTLVGQAPPLLVNVAGVSEETTGPSGLVLAGSAGTAPSLPDWLQVTVVLPTRKVAVVPGTSAAV